MTTTVYHLFKETVERHGPSVAAKFKQNNQWVNMNWHDLNERVQAVSSALIELGVPDHSKVAIMSNTRIEWVIADLGILGTGCTTVPIYQSSTGDDAQYIINDAEITFAFVEDAKQVKKLGDVKAQMPNLQKLISFQPVEESDWVISWDKFLEMGKAHFAKNQETAQARMANVKPDDLLTIVYTSGTTGRPKGAMVTHDNMVYEAQVIKELAIITPHDVQLFFLPLAHIFAKVLEVTWFTLAHQMAFAEDLTKVVDNLKEIKPHFMASVPRIFEKVHAKVVAGATTAGGIKGRLATWAIGVEEKTAKAEAQGKSGGLAWTIANKLVFKKIAAKLDETFGGNLRFCISGGAPLSPEIAYFFKHAGVIILEGYGLTETSAATCVNLPNKVKIGTVGPALPGTTVKIAEDDGEILIQGRGVFKGYWNKPEATNDALQNGWFHTGDIGQLDQDGYLKITGRKKDIIVTAGGKKIPPQNLENTLKSRCPLISQIVIHGDKRKFLSAVITLDEANLKDWGTKNGVAGEYADLCQNDLVKQEVDHAVKTYNSELASYESIKKYAILTKDFSIESGELTPSLKIKRNVVNANYKAVFDGFYADGSVGGND
jgi:long-chain acyl-CoA synthetase